MVTDTPVGQEAKEAGNECGDDPNLAAMFRGTTIPDGELADRFSGGGGADDPHQQAPHRVREGVVDSYSFRSVAHDDFDVANTEASVINRVETDRLRSES